MYVTMSVDVEAPPEKVWPYLVEPEKMYAVVHRVKELQVHQRGVGGRGLDFLLERGGNWE